MTDRDKPKHAEILPSGAKPDTRLGRRMVMLGTGGVLAAATAGVAQKAAAMPSTADPRWQAQFEAKDSWLEAPHTRHRLVFDALTPKGVEAALEFADNFYVANKTAYGLDPDALGVVIILRHMATPFGYNDHVWAKFGTAFAEKFNLDAKRAIDAVHGNPFGMVSASASAADRAATPAALAQRGVRFAICGMATTAIAGMIAKQTGGSAQQVHHEFVSNLIANALIVPAGIVAVNRAQEHGYALAYAG
ncbi:MAG: hypothetical protein KGO02_10280 [Alphaproteobacteria bacterium]|nr:hypothetical protein [Alphaproteobacteria bacterium]